MEFEKKYKHIGSIYDKTISKDIYDDFTNKKLNKDNIVRFINMCNDKTKSYVIDKIMFKYKKINPNSHPYFDESVNYEIISILHRIYIYTINKF